MKILIIIVTYNGMKWLPKVLESVSAYDVMVVDNGSSDEIVAWLRTDFPDVKLVENKENIGFGKANNIGLQYAVDNDYDYVYLLNQDAWVFPDTIPTLVRLSESNPGFGILSPMQMKADGETLDRNFKRRCGKYLDAAVSELVEVHFAMAAHWLIPVSVLKVIGAFSPAFPHYGEDNNFVHRARYHGFKIGVARSAKAIHDRESRKESKSKHMWRKYMTAVAEVENPGRIFAVQIVIQSLLLVLFSLAFLSQLPIKYMFMLLGGLLQLRRLRKESKQPGAFLK